MTTLKPFWRYVNGMPEFGQTKKGVNSSEFKRKTIPVSRLVSTNKGGYLDEKRVQRYADRWFPNDIWVIEHGGWYYIADGHHTAAAAIISGRSRISARVKRMG